MIHDIDEGLRDLLDARVVRGANIDIALDLPDGEWAAKRQGPAINLYLYDVREDLERRQVQYEPQYDSGGIVTGRVTPPRRFKLHYMVTAWAQRAEDEHRLLSAIMATFLVSDEFPREFLRGSAATVGPLRTTIALPAAGGPSLSELWSRMGGMRPILDLIVTIPMGAREDPHVGPPVLEGPKFSILGPDGQPVVPMRRAAGAAAADGDQSDEDEVPSAPPGAPDAPQTREVIDAGRFRRGRQVVELSDDDLAPGRRVGLGTIPRPPT